MQRARTFKAKKLQAAMTTAVSAKALRSIETVPLQPGDFDNVQYKVEMVRLPSGPGVGSSGVDDDDDGFGGCVDPLDLAFVALLFVVVLGGCVALGLAGDVMLFVKGALWYTMPALALPLVWVLALHVWETRTEPQQPQVTSPSVWSASVS